MQIGIEWRNFKEHASLAVPTIVYVSSESSIQNSSPNASLFIGSQVTSTVECRLSAKLRPGEPWHV